MTRTSKQAERRAQSPRRTRLIAGVKTGAKVDNLPKGYKNCDNAVEGTAATGVFIRKMR